jgi:non-ribosomal peptide synthetase component E (peptide arylation enzyme)
MFSTFAIVVVDVMGESFGCSNKLLFHFSGHQIAPADLEAVLVEHPEIVDVAVTS